MLDTQSDAKYRIEPSKKDKVESEIIDDPIEANIDAMITQIENARKINPPPQAEIIN